MDATGDTEGRSQLRERTFNKSQLNSKGERKDTNTQIIHLDQDGTHIL